MNTTKLWLSYYKNSLADADRKKIEVPFVPETGYGFMEKVPENLVRMLWNGIGKENDFLAIDIAPVSLQPTYEHAKAKEALENVIYPFWIPARINREGSISVEKKKAALEAPFFIRDYLSPNASHIVIASLEKADEELHEFSSENWKEYWQESEAYFKAVTGKTFEQFNAKGHQLVIQAGQGRNMSSHILKLYNQLGKEENLGDKRLLTQLLEPDSRITSFPSKEELYANTTHYAQMSDSFPLSFSQRETMRLFTEDKDILAVNGPPGTGKTTLLQSVAANSVVKAVLNQAPPQLLVASSTNNQAITNILESFKLASDSLLAQRWLPGLQSLGLYLSSTGDKKKYQVMTSAFGNGFPEEYELDDPQEKTLYFIERFKQTGEKAATLEACKQALYAKVKHSVDAVKAHIDVALRLSTISVLLEKAGCTDLAELEKKYLLAKEAAAFEKAATAKLQQTEAQLKSTAQNFGFFLKYFSFLKKVREQREATFQEIVHENGFKNVPVSDKLDELLAHFSHLLVAQKEVQQQKEAQERLLQVTQQEILEINTTYVRLKAEWVKQYGHRLKELQNKTGEEYQHLEPLPEMAVCMDISYRFEAFWYAVHYREAEYLLLLQAQKEKSFKEKERSEEAYRTKLQRIACLTPVFICTFHSLPRFATYYKQNAENPFYNLFDLLIVDEAGQVSPDIAMPSFALAKKAVLVGDVFQIEPVWSVTQGVDTCNLVAGNILPSNYTETEYQRFQATGKPSYGGNIMKIAQNACSYERNGLRGAVLTEHRRCLDSIIEFSNRYIYNHTLMPKVGSQHQIPHSLPDRGYLHVDSASEISGTSRCNPTDARIIAKWIVEHTDMLEKAYQKPIFEIVAIISPFKAQALFIATELKKINFSCAKIVSGTVNAMQGAEKPVIIYSSVLSGKDSLHFVNRSYNLLNVAVSRAKHSFIVIGNINVLNPLENSPLGNLAKWLFSSGHGALSSKLVFEEEELFPARSEKISSLEKHQSHLRNALETAQREVLIVSPCISVNAIEHDQLETLIRQAKEKNVRVIIVTDHYLDTENGILKAHAFKGRQLLEASGAIIHIHKGIHSKIISVDDHVISVGSFNWLAAVRDKSSAFYRHETSVVINGEPAKQWIKELKEELQLDVNSILSF